MTVGGAAAVVDFAGSFIAGVAGRIPVFELFVVDTAVSDLISRSAPKATLLEVSRQKGMKSLAEEALMRVYAGYIDLASVSGYIFEAGY